jgi:hypothetical protein
MTKPTHAPAAPAAPTTAAAAATTPAAAAKPAKELKAPKEPKEPKAPKVEREKQNGQTKPAEGTLTRKLWDIIDSISATTKEPATRKAVMEAAASATPPFNAAMSASLYSHWRKFHGLTGNAAPGRAAKAEAPATGEAPAAPKAPAA